MICSPSCKSIFNVVAGSVNKNTVVLPASTLHTHILYHSTETLELSVADGNGYGRDEL